MTLIEIDKIVESEKNHRARELQRVEYKLSKISLWEKRRVALSDTSFAVKVKERLEILQSILAKEGFIPDVTKMALTRYDGRSLVGTLNRDKVSMDVEGYIRITSNGVVSVELDRIAHDDSRWHSSRTRALRVSIGKETRITNDILKALLWNPKE